MILSATIFTFFFKKKKNLPEKQSLIYLNFLDKMSQLPVDCLNEIFEYLEEDKETLRSCLLVNRLWSEVSVRILWRSVRNYRTLIACLPNESREVLRKNGINISTPTKSPLYNYIT